MTNSYKFSIIIPIWNSEKYLRECLDSIFSQSYSNFEVILINDGSVDGSEEICADYIKKYKNVSYYKLNHAGVSKARNLGIEKARGEYLLFCDSDDYYSKDFLGELSIYANGEVDIINFGHFVDQYENNVLINVVEKKVSNDILITHDEWKTKIHDYWNASIGKLPCWDKAFLKRTIIENNVKYNEKQLLLEDFSFVIKAWDASKNMLLVSKLFYHVRRNIEEKMIMKRNPLNTVQSIDLCMNDFHSFCTKNNINFVDFPEAISFIYNWYLYPIWIVKDITISYGDSKIIISELFSKELFLSLIKKCAGKKVKLLLFIIKLKLYHLATTFIKKIY